MMLPPCISENVPLAGMTTFGIGGSARYLSRPATLNEVLETYSFAAREHLPVLVLGGGSNLLVADSGVDAVVLRLDEEAFGRIETDDSDPLVWRVGAAAQLPGVVARAAKAGLSGLEFLAGIPGRIGGAAAMNAGGAEYGIGTRIEKVDGVDGDGIPFSFSGSELGFRYRGSALLGRTALFLTLRFAEQGDPEQIRKHVRIYREQKSSRQPVGTASAGCIFANPPGTSAGLLLDRAGCKGLREGGAEVSSLHANFIVNTGNATSDNVARLAKMLRQRVFDSTGVTLVCEIKMWGNDPLFAELGGALV